MWEKGIQKQRTLFVLLCWLLYVVPLHGTSSSVSWVNAAHPSRVLKGEETTLTLTGFNIASSVQLEATFLPAGAAASQNLTILSIDEGGEFFKAAITVPSGAEAVLLQARKSSEDWTRIGSPFLVYAFSEPTFSITSTDFSPYGYDKVNITSSEILPDQEEIVITATANNETIEYELNRIFMDMNTIEIVSLPFVSADPGDTVSIRISLDRGVHFTDVLSSTLRFDEAVHIGFIYAEPIANGGFAAMHNVARFHLDKVFGSRIRTFYVDNSFRNDEGELVASEGLRHLVEDKNCTVIVAAGAQFLPTVESNYDRYPHVHYIIPSGWISSFNNYDRVSIVNVKRSEGTYIGGILAGGVTKTNVICYIQPYKSTVLHNIGNAFLLGARRVNPNVQMKVYFTDVLSREFLHDWTDFHAAKEMRDKHNCDVLVPFSGLDAPLYFTKGGAYTVGFKRDLRIETGDSTLFSFTESYNRPYEILVRDILLGEFTSSVHWFGSRSEAASTSSFSPHVPTHIQRFAHSEIDRLAHEMRPVSIFCGEIFLSNGTILNEGGDETVCMTSAERDSMDFWLEGAEHLGEYVAPPKLTISVRTLDTQTYYVFVILGIVTSVCAAAMFFLVTRARRKPLMKAASVPFLLVNLVGIMVLTNYPALFGAYELDETGTSDIACQMRPWLLSNGFVLMFAPLVLKTYRAQDIFNTRQLAKRPLTNAQLGQILLVLLALNAVVCSMWQLTDPMEMRIKRVNPSLETGHDYAFRVCESQNSGEFIIVLGVIVLALVLSGSMVAFQSRNIPKEFSDSRQIVVTIQTIVLFCIIGLPVAIFLHSDVEANFVVTSAIVSVSTIATLMFVFGPKLVIIFWSAERLSSDDVDFFHRNILSRAASAGKSSTAPTSSSVRPYIVTTANRKAPLTRTLSITSTGLRGSLRRSRSGSKMSVRSGRSVSSINEEVL